MLDSTIKTFIKEFGITETKKKKFRCLYDWYTKTHNTKDSKLMNESYTTFEVILHDDNIYIEVMDGIRIKGNIITSFCSNYNSVTFKYSQAGRTLKIFGNSYFNANEEFEFSYTLSRIEATNN